VLSTLFIVRMPLAGLSWPGGSSSPFPVLMGSRAYHPAPSHASSRHNATADRAGIGAIRVRQSFEYDTGFLEETPGTPPFVHSSAHEPDVRAAGALIGEAKKSNDFVVVALHCMPRPEVAASILARFAAASRDLDPSVVVGDHGVRTTRPVGR
jgi:hypothetical protein